MKKGARKHAATAYRELERLDPGDVDEFDFRIFDDFGGITDSPVGDFFPHIFRAYPKAAPGN